MRTDGPVQDSSTSGWFEGRAHVFPLRVYYEDTDAAGIVYYANYLRFAERARTEMMRCLGTEHGSLLEESGIAFAVRHCAADYALPARLDDALVVRSRVREVRGASMRAEQVVARCEPAGGETELVHLQIRLACMDGNLRPARLPRDVRAALERLVAEA